jgi:hypothetical protein
MASLNASWQPPRDTTPQSHLLSVSFQLSPPAPPSLSPPSSRRLPDPATGQQRFKFAAPGELTSISVPLPLYHLPPLPEPDQPLRQPLPAAKLLPVEVGGVGGFCTL